MSSNERPSADETRRPRASKLRSGSQIAHSAMSTSAIPSRGLASARRSEARARAARARSASPRRRGSRSLPTSPAYPGSTLREPAPRRTQVSRHRRCRSRLRAGGRACGLPPRSGRPRGSRRSSRRGPPQYRCTSRPSGSSYVVRRTGFVRNSAVAEPSRATSSNSPTSHASNVSFLFLFGTVPLIGSQ